MHHGHDGHDGARQCRANCVTQWYCRCSIAAMHLQPAPCKLPAAMHHGALPISRKLRDAMHLQPALHCRPQAAGCTCKLQAGTGTCDVHHGACQYRSMPASNAPQSLSPRPPGSPEGRACQWDTVWELGRIGLGERPAVFHGLTHQAVSAACRAKSARTPPTPRPVQRSDSVHAACPNDTGGSGV